MQQHSTLLPREGLYVDPIIVFLRKTLLNPLFNIPLFGALQFYTPQTSSLTRQIAGCAAAIGCLLNVNDWLSAKSRNNWVTDENWDWGKEIVVVTGGSGGIGGSVAQRLAGDGVRVVVVDIVPLTYEIGEKPISYYRCDLSGEKEIAGVCEHIRREVGNPTVLLNNAGLCRGRTVAEGTYHDNSITLRTNLLAPILLAKEFLPHMIHKNHGHIFNVGSMSAYIPPAGVADYAASKAGMIAFHEALGVELKYRHNAPKVRTSIAILSFTQTPLFKGETNQSHFISPLMHVDTVGDAIVDTLYSGYGRTIYLPRILGFLTWIRGAPEWIQDEMRASTESLKVDFAGRQQVDSRTGKLFEGPEY